MDCTVFGARGFIGSHLAAHLESEGHRCSRPEREGRLSDALGHVFYCIGLTADFRRRPYETAQAHVGALSRILEHGRFESLLYLSSTRVYARSSSSDEDAVLSASPADTDDYYNLTKMTGEALCFASGRPGARVARLSNVYGPDFESDNFLSAIIRSAVDTGSVTVESSLDSEKDYVSVRDVVSFLPKIAFSGRARIYNVAAGRNTGNAELLRELAAATGCRVSVKDGAPTVKHRPINVSRVVKEFSFKPASLAKELGSLVTEYRERKRDPHRP